MHALRCQPLARATLLCRAGNSLPRHLLVRRPRTEEVGSSYLLACRAQQPQQKEQQLGLAARTSPRPSTETASRSVRAAMAEAVPARSPQSYEGLLFRQLFESVSSTYTYILADASNKAFPGVVRVPLSRVSRACLLRACGAICVVVCVNSRRIFSVNLLFV